MLQPIKLGWMPSLHPFCLSECESPIGMYRVYRLLIDGIADKFYVVSESMPKKFRAEANSIEECQTEAQYHFEDVFSQMYSKDSGQQGVWPNFIAPSQYENPPATWTDPRLPDFTIIWQVARRCGYSIGLHGSMKRDCDLIAAPWDEWALTPEELIADLCATLNLNEIGKIEPKPHGRVAVSLQKSDAYVKTIDLSIMPVLRA